MITTQLSTALAELVHLQDLKAKSGDTLASAFVAVWFLYETIGTALGLPTATLTFFSLVRLHLLPDPRWGEAPLGLLLLWPQWLLLASLLVLLRGTPQKSPQGESVSLPVVWPVWLRRMLLVRLAHTTLPVPGWLRRWYGEAAGHQRLRLPEAGVQYCLSGALLGALGCFFLSASLADTPRVGTGALQIFALLAVFCVALIYCLVPPKLLRVTENTGAGRQIIWDVHQTVLPTELSLERRLAERLTILRREGDGFVYDARAQEGDRSIRLDECDHVICDPLAVSSVAAGQFSVQSSLTFTCSGRFAVTHIPLGRSELRFEHQSLAILQGILEGEHLRGTLMGALQLAIDRYTDGHNGFRNELNRFKLEIGTARGTSTAPAARELMDSKPKYEPQRVRVVYQLLEMEHQNTIRKSERLSKLEDAWESAWALREEARRKFPAVVHDQLLDGITTMIPIEADRPHVRSFLEHLGIQFVVDDFLLSTNAEEVRAVIDSEVTGLVQKSTEEWSTFATQISEVEAEKAALIKVLLTEAAPTTPTQLAVRLEMMDKLLGETQRSGDGVDGSAEIPPSSLPVVPDRPYE